MARDSIYQDDLACIHHIGFGDFSRRAAPGLLRLIHRAGIHGGTLVDLGCGSGLWAKVAVRAGFNVIGVDQSRAMIRLAKRVAPAAKFVRASLYDFNLPPCDAVTAIGEGLNYLPSNEHRPRGLQLSRFFGRVAQALRPGGVFIFDVFLAGDRPMRGRNWWAGKDWVALTAVDEQPRARRLQRSIVTFRKIGARWHRREETHHIRVFTSAEIRRALSGAGFSVQMTREYGVVRLAPRRLAFIARKRG
jgi:SAM-dependent methyltransferase